MGKFGNSPKEMYHSAYSAWEANGREGPEPEMTMEGAYIGPRPKDAFAAEGGNPEGLNWHGKSEFEAMGLPVPNFRKSAGIRHLKDMGFSDRERMDEIVGKMVASIERDDSHEALEVAMRLGCDATACYRMLAVLLTEPEPAEYAA